MTALTTNEARLQAEEFHNLIKDKSVQARPAMDYENFDGLEREDINAIGLAFLEELEKALNVLVVCTEYAICEKLLGVNS